MRQDKLTPASECPLRKLIVLILFARYLPTAFCLYGPFAEMCEQLNKQQTFFLNKNITLKIIQKITSLQMQSGKKKVLYIIQNTLMIVPYIYI